MSSELKPCPFCGGEAILCKEIMPEASYKTAYVECQSCGCNTRHYIIYGTTTIRDPINVWNRRVNENEIL